MSNIKNDLSVKIAQLIEENKTPLTISGVIGLMLDTNILDNKRACQFLAVAEFYDGYGNTSKTKAIKELSKKYDISERNLYDLLGKDKKFNL